MRGIIMETKNGRAVLLTKNGSFVDIRDKGYSVGDKINSTPNTGRLCAMAASLLVVCAGIGSYFIPAGYVSVDINPSLMMTLNPYNRVIDVQTFNDDARTLLSKTNIKGKGAEESVEMLIKVSEEIGYINDNNHDVILEIVPGMIKPNMERIHHPNIELTNETADRETLRMAQSIGMSMAKAKAIEEYTEKNGGDIRSNAAKFDDKSAKEMRAIMRDDGHLSDKKPPEMPSQNHMSKEPKNAPKPPKPQTNGVSDAKQPYNIKTDSFPVIEQRTDKNIPDNQPPQSGYISPGMEHQSSEIPPMPNESSHPELVPVNNHTQPSGNNVPLHKPINEPEQEFQSIHTEQQPHDKIPFQGGGKPEFPKHTEHVSEDNVPSVNPHPSEDEKTQDGNTGKNEPQNENDNSYAPERKPNNEVNQGKEDLTDNPQAEKQPGTSEHTTDKMQVHLSKPKFDEPPQDNILPDVPKHEDIPMQSNPQPGEQKREDAPPRGESQNSGGNPPTSENMGGHNEHKEM